MMTIHYTYPPSPPKNLDTDINLNSLHWRCTCCANFLFFQTKHRKLKNVWRDTHWCVFCCFYQWAWASSSYAIASIMYSLCACYVLPSGLSHIINAFDSSNCAEMPFCVSYTHSSMQEATRIVVCRCTMWSARYLNPSIPFAMQCVTLCVWFVRRLICTPLYLRTQGSFFPFRTRTGSIDSKTKRKSSSFSKRYVVEVAWMNELGPTLSLFIAILHHRWC